MSTVQNRPEEPQPEDSMSLETRFGLVMYGGVSLAIYINGVAREFFRAVRGAGVYKLVKALTDRDVVVDVISGTSAGGINGIMLSYALCNNKDFASCSSLWRLDGDVRSLLRSPHGSADTAESLFDSESFYQPRLEAAFREMPDYVEEDGELNSKFKELDLFVTGTDVDGQISTQFDDAGHPIDVKDHRSLFLLKHRQGRKHPFEPGSSVDGPSTPDTTFQALAKLARITSCFPAAFTPVYVSGSEPPGNATVDGKLQLWGGLNKDSCFLDGGVIDNKPFTYTIREIFGRAADRVVERKLFYVEPDPEHFNRPDVASRPNFVQAVIASLIGIPGYESIADDLRLLAQHNTKVQQYRRLRRHLEERASRSGEEANAPSPQDRELYDRCSLVALSERIIEGILKANGRVQLLSQKHRARATALIEAFDDVQEQLRRVTVHDEMCQAQVPTFVRNFNVYFRLRRLYRTIYKIVDVLGKKVCVCEEDEMEIKRFTNLWRVFNREIEMLEIVRANMERFIDDAPIRWKETVDESDGVGRSEKTLKEDTAKEARIVWDVVTEGLHRFLDRRGDAAKLLREAFTEVLAEVKSVEENPGKKLDGFSRDSLTAFNKALREKAKGVIAQIDKDEIRSWVIENRQELEGRSRSFNSILQSARKFEEEVIAELLPVGEGMPEEKSRDRQAVTSAYANFSDFDAQLFPIEFVADLNEKDVIETIRISPLDAERGFSNKGLSDKVSGDALYHFGGFFKRSWRSNDILWGRLDSLCQLTETLLTPEMIQRVLDNRLLLERVRRRFFVQREGNDNDRNEDYAAPGWDWVPALRPSRLFPHAGKATQSDLDKWLKGLLLEGKKLDRDDFSKTKIARIIEAAQLEVIYEDLPGVIADALEEQARWNQFRYPSDLLKSSRRTPEDGNGKKGEGKFDPTSFPPVYLPAKGKLDAFASVIAAAGAASDAMRHLEKRPAAGTTPMDTGVGQFFSRDYRIGSEALLRDLPPLILMEIISTTLLVVRNCLLKLFGSQAERIKKYPLYVFGVDLPLRAFHTMVRFMRQAPASQKVAPFALGVLSALLLAIGIYWRKPIIWTPPTQQDPGGFQLLWFVLFIGGPLVVLTAEAVYLYQGKVSELTVLRTLRDVLLALLILLPCFVALAVYVTLYDKATDALTHLFGGWKWLASGAVFASVLLTLIAPLIAFALLARLGRWGRSGAGRLRERLQKYFSIPEMLAVARRLDLFKDKDVQGLAEELEVFDAASLAEITKRHRELLGDFSVELERKLGLPDAKRSSVYTEGVAAEGRKVRYGAIIEIYNKAERARKREAYDQLSGKLAEIEAQHRTAVEAGLPRAGVLTEEKKVQAVNAMLEAARRVEALKTNLAYASIESTQRTDDSRRAADLLARRIVEEATARDRGPGLSKRVTTYLRRDKSDAAPPEAVREKSDEKQISMLARLEDMMYSINPGAMN